MECLLIMTEPTSLYRFISSVAFGRLFYHLDPWFLVSFLVMFRDHITFYFATHATDLPPRQIENCIDRFETPTCQLWNEQPVMMFSTLINKPNFAMFLNSPNPSQSNECNYREKEHGPIELHVQKHGRHSFRVAKLIRKVNSHCDGPTDGPQSQRIYFLIQKVLNTVPAHCPAKTAEIDHDYSASSGTLLGRTLNDCLVANSLINDQEECHVQHANAL
jgi:hypothetical protein